MNATNERGETPDHGPLWACAMYGQPEHDYNDCVHCNKAYLEHLDAIREGRKP